MLNVDLVGRSLRQLHREKTRLKPESPYQAPFPLVPRRFDRFAMDKSYLATFLPWLTLAGDVGP